MVGQLNQLVHVFDGLVEKHGVEKIKTIGDCYMLAGGVPDHQEDHAQRVANVALDMTVALARFSRRSAFRSGSAFTADRWSPE